MRPDVSQKRANEHWFVSALLKPFRLLWWMLTRISELSVAQIRSLATVAFLAGIIALSAENWGLTFYADHAAHQISEGIEGSRDLMAFLLERMRYTSALQAWFAIIIGAVILGAEYVSLKLGEYEATMGKKAEEKPTQKGKGKPEPLLDEEEDLDDLRTE